MFLPYQNIAGLIKSLPIKGLPTQKILSRPTIYTGKNLLRIFAGELSAEGDFFRGRSYNGVPASQTHRRRPLNLCRRLAAPVSLSARPASTRCKNNVGLYKDLDRFLITVTNPTRNYATLQCTALYYSLSLILFYAKGGVLSSNHGADAVTIT